MKFGRTLALQAAVIAILAASPAAADIVFDSSIIGLGQGFGAAPRLLTVQQTGNSPNPAGIESACDSNDAGALSVGTCSGLDASFQANGLIDAGGDSVNGLNKDNLINLSDAGITDASQIVLIYNPSQEGSDPATDIYDIILKFYDADNNLVISVDGGCGSTCNNDATDPLYFGDTGVNLGNGGTGFALVLDAIQANAVNQACGQDFSGCITLAGEATIWNANDGPDSFVFFNSNDVTTECTPGVDCVNVPEPITLSLFGAGLAGAAVLGRRRRKSI